LCSKQILCHRSYHEQGLDNAKLCSHPWSDVSCSIWFPSHNLLVEELSPPKCKLSLKALCLKCRKYITDTIRICRKKLLHYVIT
jgi:hypothetical protein